MLAGWSRSDSTPPRLSASVNTRVADATARAARPPPLSTTETIPPNPFI